MYTSSGHAICCLLSVINFNILRNLEWLVREEVDVLGNIESLLKISPATIVVAMNSMRILLGLYQHNAFSKEASFFL